MVQRKRLAVDITEDQHYRLKRLAAVQGISMTELVLSLLHKDLMTRSYFDRDFVKDLEAQCGKPFDEIVLPYVDEFIEKVGALQKPQTIGG